MCVCACVCPHIHIHIHIHMLSVPIYLFISRFSSDGPFTGQDAYISLNSRMESDVKEKDRDVLRLQEDLLEREGQVERLKVVGGGPDQRTHRWMDG